MVRDLMAHLIACDRWLPEAFAQAGQSSYAQHLLHCDPLERFSVVSFVWGPGAATPIHNHTVWGLVGMLRGAEISTEYLPGAPMPYLAALPERRDVWRQRLASYQGLKVACVWAGRPSSGPGSSGKKPRSRGATFHRAATGAWSPDYLRRRGPSSMTAFRSSGTGTW